MPAIPGLRSPHDKLGSLAYVGRMFDKIRLHDRGQLPEDYQSALGIGFDQRACDFLGIAYDDLKAKVLTGASDEDILAWCFANGHLREEHDCIVWSAFLQKLGWRDYREAALHRRVATAGLADRGIKTFCDLIEVDEDRPIQSNHD